MRPPGALLCAAALLCAGCTGNEHAPDQLLRDSLGLGDGDVVHMVELTLAEGAERVVPSTVEIEPGNWVAFRAADRHVHAVSFVLDGLAPEQAAALREQGAQRSPPLLELDARWVVRFEGAPPGRYPFLVEGNGREARGEVVVVADEG